MLIDVRIVAARRLGASQSFLRFMRMACSMSKRLGLNWCVSSHAVSDRAKWLFILAVCSGNNTFIPIVCTLAASPFTSLSLGVYTLSRQNLRDCK